MHGLWTGPVQRVDKDKVTRPVSMRGLEAKALQRAVQGTSSMQNVMFDTSSASGAQSLTTHEIDQALVGGDRPIFGAAERHGGGLSTFSFLALIPHSPPPLLYN